MQPGGAPAGGAGRGSPSSPAAAAAAGPSQPMGFRNQVLHHQDPQQMQQQQQQQQAYQTGVPYGVMAGANNFLQSSSTMLPLQQQRKFNDMGHPMSQLGSMQFQEESQVKRDGHVQLTQDSYHQMYLQYAMQASAQQKTQETAILMQQHQAKLNMASPAARNQDLSANSSKMQELMSLQAANQATMFKRKLDPQEKQIEQGKSSGDQRSDPRPSQGAAGQPLGPNLARPAQPVPSQANMNNIANNQLAMAQMQAMQTWAKENNIDLSNPANRNIAAQLLPIWQSSRMAQMQKQNETAAAAQKPMQTSMPPTSGETSQLGNATGQALTFKPRPAFPPSVVPSGGEAKMVNMGNMQLQHQVGVHGRDGQSERVGRPQIVVGNGGPMMLVPQTSSGFNQASDLKSSASQDMAQLQYLKQMQQVTRSTQNVSSSEPSSSHAPLLGQRPQYGFTKHQLHVLKAQILAFRRLKRGDRTLPQEVIEAIMSPAEESLPKTVTPQPVLPNRETNTGINAEDQAELTEINREAQDISAASKRSMLPKMETSPSEDRAATGGSVQATSAPLKEASQTGHPTRLNQNTGPSIKAEPEAEGSNQKASGKSDCNVESAKSMPSDSDAVDAEQSKKSASTSSTAPAQKDVPRKYHGPIFDFPSFTRKPDGLGSTNAQYNSNLMLGYDVRDLLAEEGKIVLSQKRADNLKKINGLLAINLERKRISPDVVLRLQIEEKKLRLMDLQARLRDEVEQEQQEIMAMPDRPYRKFVRQCERQRAELIRQVQQMQKLSREKQLKSIIQWRKKLLEAHWAIRDARTTRNRGVAKYHEKMLKEFSKRKDDNHNKRMEALKNNDVDRYRELLEQQTSVPGDAAQRYTVLSSFLTQTEEYLLKVGGKITAAKNHQEVEEAARTAAAAARAQGLSEEEVKAAAACAGEEVMIRNRFSEMNAPKDTSSVKKYYNLAHAVTERVVRQPSMLRAGTLRDYQLVGLQWMLSLYNNKLNGILADEMGLGKTVQVMSLIAYLMEFKGNYGPHLIIVPNAVLVNWKSELMNWLPSISCVFYVGAKEQRLKLFSQEVCALKFNVLVTTYEFVMYDRAKLSKIDWKYIIIDEAQRMKDRESVLARDLDRYRCQRRLLLTGTPLQNDLKELWSLLNLLLPEVFDNRKAFHDWFSQPFQRDGPSHGADEDDWLETEKKVIIIHRLHQILEPFMLRRRVQDVEGSLPRKESIVLKCRMSAMQGAIYDWIKSTGTIRVDPEDEKIRSQKNPMYQVKTCKNLNNKCMELRKACNHPLLNYPYIPYYSKDFIVRSCGKLWLLDRILVKLHHAGHRVLLFSTMTKLLDILEDYLQWRGLIYRRIDGTTSLEDRESAIVDFNRPDTDCFIFLLSIRAAGRGLNLQTADTVVIYDPDPNPQNEEQAVARAHRIGQTREVKVIYMEAVVDKIPSYQKEDDVRSGGSGDLEDDLAGRDRYVGSIESLIRNNIQQYKIDMADEVINAGRFDQRTTHEERRMTLETLLHDEERYQETVHDVPSMQEVNRMIARSEEEVDLFDQMDERFQWTGDMLKHDQVPRWLRPSSTEVNTVLANLKKKPSKSILSGNTGNYETTDVMAAPSLGKSDRKRATTKNLAAGKYSIYRELDDEDIEDSDADSEERNTSSIRGEEGETGEFEDEEYNDPSEMLPDNKEQSEDGLINDDTQYDFTIAQTMESGKENTPEEAGSSGSSSRSQRVQQPAASSISSQKFGSLSALDARPGPASKRMVDDLEEGEIALSGDSHADIQQSGSWTHDRDDPHEEQSLQPKLKRKRSLRIPRFNVSRLEDRSAGEVPFSRGPQFPFQGNREPDSLRLRSAPEVDVETAAGLRIPVKQKRNMQPRKASPVLAHKSTKLTHLSSGSGGGGGGGGGGGSAEPRRVNNSSKTIGSSVTAPTSGKMSDIMQRKCLNVISKLWKKIGKEGHQTIPILSDWWQRNETSSFKVPTGSILDLQKIEKRVDSFEYIGVDDFIADVQQMLKSVVRYFNYKHEVRQEAEILHGLFFDIMKIAFPDTDFREARNAVSFSSSGGPSTHAPPPSSKQQAATHGKRQLQSSETVVPSGGTKKSQHGPALAGEGSTRSHATKLPSHDYRSSFGEGRDLLPDGNLVHPGDLVIFKKKRKDRPRAGTGSPSSSGRVGPLSPPSVGRMGPTPSGSASRNTKPAPLRSTTHGGGWGVHPAQQLDRGTSLSPGIGDVQWAKPVKRLRTDSGKRRPSHL